MLEPSKEIDEITQGFISEKELQELIKLAMFYPAQAQFLNILIEQLNRNQYFEAFKSIYECEDDGLRLQIIKILKME